MSGSSLIFIAVFVVLIYALMIMPQRRQQKQKAEMMKKLGRGSKIMTASGIFGQVVEIHDSIMVVKIAEGVDIEMDSRAVARVIENSSAPTIEAASSDLEGDRVNQE